MAHLHPLIAEKVPGCDLGDDMNHRNIIAALEVKCDGQTKESERFGAVVRKLPIVPLPPHRGILHHHLRLLR